MFFLLPLIIYRLNRGKASKGFNLPLLALLPFTSGELLTIFPEVAPVCVLPPWIVSAVLKGKVFTAAYAASSLHRAGELPTVPLAVVLVVIGVYYYPTTIFAPVASPLPSGGAAYCCPWRWFPSGGCLRGLPLLS